MKQFAAIALLLAFALFPCSAARAQGTFEGDAQKPLAYLHAGKLLSAEKSEAPLDFVDLDYALKAQEAQAPAFVPVDHVMKKNPPAGSSYVVLNIAVMPGRSISVADYVLAADDGNFPCIGLATEHYFAFDDRTLLVKGPATARMLFACPKAALRAELLPAPGFPLLPVKGLELRRGNGGAGNAVKLAD